MLPSSYTSESHDSNLTVASLFSLCSALAVVRLLVSPVQCAWRAHLLVCLPVLEMRAAYARGVCLVSCRIVLASYFNSTGQYSHNLIAGLLIIISVPLFVATPGVDVVEPPPLLQASPMLVTPDDSKTLLFVVSQSKTALRGRFANRLLTGWEPSQQFGGT